VCVFGSGAAVGLPLPLPRCRHVVNASRLLWTFVVFCCCSCFVYMYVGVCAFWP